MTPLNTLWHIQLLGGLQARQGERLVSRFQTYKTGALFAYLAFHASQPHPREVLIELLWPEATLESARNSLSVALSSLRRQLEPPGTPTGAVLRSDRSRAQLNPAAITTDVTEFLAAAKNAPKSEEGGEAIPRLREAVGLYCGELLPGYYEDWVGAERGRLTDAYLNTLYALIQRLADNHAYDEALEYTHRAIQADPLREASHRTLMRLYAAAGRPATALEHFRGLERLLKQSLDVAPAKATHALVTEIAGRIGQERHAPTVVPTVPVESAPLVSSPPPKAPTEPRLPTAFTRFFGREQDIRRLRQLLTDPAVRLVTLTGPGGMGKSRLAVETAGGLAEKFGGRVWFVPLADVLESERVMDAIRDTLGLPRKPDGDTEDQVVGALSTEPGLLILDNFEQLAEDGAGAVQRLLEQAPRLTCLVTSRQLLNLGGEHELSLAPLPTPDARASRESISQAPSVQMFVDRAQTRRADFQVTPGNAKTIAALCAALEGMPLALELAAAWTGVLTPAQMLARLGHRLDLLVSQRKDLPERHRSLRAALDSSYRFLSSDAQRLFARLSVFRGGWTLEAAHQVCAEVQDDEEEATLDLMRRLQERSLLTAQEVGGEMRYRMYETMREYAAEQLTPDEADQVAQRHGAFFLTLARAIGRTVTWAEKVAWMDRLDADMENLRVAFVWALARDVEAVLKAATQLSLFWHIRGHAAEGRALLSDGINAAGATVPEETRLRALVEMGQLAQVQGDYGPARETLEQALHAYRDVDDPAGEAIALGYLSDVLMNQGDYDVARTLTEKALRFHRAAGNRSGEAGCLSRLGYIARERGEPGTARDLLERSIALHVQMGDELGATSTRGSLAYAVLSQGDRDYARTLLEQTLAAYRRWGNWAGQAWALTSLANVAREQEDNLMGRALLREALALNRHVGNRAGEAWNLESLGEALTHEGDFPAAHEALAQALAINQSIGSRSSEARNLRGLGDVAFRQGDVSRADRLYAEALRLMRELDMPRDICGVLEALAECWTRRGDEARAAKLFGAAEASRRLLGLTINAGETRVGLGDEAQVREYESGKALSLSQAIAFALEEESARRAD